MRKKSNGVTIEQVYALMEEKAPFVVEKFRVPTYRFDVDDLVQESIKYFIQDGFLDKYDPKKCSLKYWAEICLNRTMIRTMRRHYQQVWRKSVSLQAPIGSSEEGDELTLESLLGETPDVMSNLVVEEVLERLGTVALGARKEFVFCRHRYPATVRSLVELLLCGVTRAELARAIGVNKNRITQYVNWTGKDLGLQQLLTQMQHG